MRAEGQEEGPQVPWGGETGVGMGARRGLEQGSMLGRDVGWYQELREAGEEGVWEPAAVQDEMAEEEREVRGGRGGRIVLVVQQSIHGVGGEGDLVLEQQAVEAVGEALAHRGCCDDVGGVGFCLLLALLVFFARCFDDCRPA